MHTNSLMLGCSSVSHTWDAFQLAHASFRLHCVRNNHVQSVKLGPRLLGDAPKINISAPETETVDEEGSSEVTPAIKIYDEEINIKLLLCGVPCALVSFYIYVQTLLLMLVPMQTNDYLFYSHVGSLFIGLFRRWSERTSEY